MRSDTGGIDLEHFLFQYEVFSPQLLDVGLDGTANRSKVVQSRTSTIDLKSLEEDISALDQIIQQFFVLLHQLSSKQRLPFCLIARTTFSTANGLLIYFSTNASAWGSI